MREMPLELLVIRTDNRQLAMFGATPADVLACSI
jgi:hypothetical protein